MCLLMEDSELMELLRNVEVNGLGLLRLWARLVAQKMGGSLLKDACFATSTTIMRSDLPILDRKE